LSLTRDQLLMILPAGHALAMSAGELGRMLGISPREVGALVAELVEAGQPIGSSCTKPYGYYVCIDAADVEHGAAHIRSRALGSLARWRAFQRACVLLVNPEQMQLWLTELEEAS